MIDGLFVLTRAFGASLGYSADHSIYILDVQRTSSDEKLLVPGCLFWNQRGHSCGLLRPDCHKLRFFVPCTLTCAYRIQFRSSSGHSIPIHYVCVLRFNFYVGKFIEMFYLNFTFPLHLRVEISSKGKSIVTIQLLGHDFISLTDVK